MDSSVLLAAAGSASGASRLLITSAKLYITYLNLAAPGYARGVLSFALLSPFMALT
jgi:hypothetical protein